MNGLNNESFGEEDAGARRGISSRVARAAIAGILVLGAIIAVVALVGSAGENEQALESATDETPTDVEATPEDQQAQSADDSAANNEMLADSPDPDDYQLGPLTVAVTPNGQVITGHAPDNIRVLTLGDNKNMQLTDVVEGRGTTAVVLSDGRVASDIGTIVNVWDPTDPDAEPEIIDTQSRIFSLTALPDGLLLVDGFDESVSEPGDGSGFQIWDTMNVDSAPITFNDPTAERQVWAALPDGRIAQGNADLRDNENHTIVIWDTSSGEAVPSTLGRHPGGVEALAVLPDGRLLSTGSDDIFRIWDVDDSDGTSPVVSIFNETEAREIVALPDGRLALVTNFRELRIWDPATPDVLFRSLIDGDRHISTIATTEDGRILVGFENETAPGIVDFDELANLEPITESDQRTSDVLAGHAGRVLSIAELSNGRLVTTSTQDQTIRLWDPAVTNQAIAVRSIERVESQPPVRFLATSLPDDRVVIADNNGEVKLWNPDVPDAPFTILQTPPAEVGPNTNLIAVVPLPDGRIAVAFLEKNIFIIDPDAPNAEPILLEGQLPQNHRGLGLLEDGRLAAVNRLGEIMIWDVNEPSATPEVIPAFGEISSAAFLSNNRVAVGDADIRISDLDELGEAPVILAADPATDQEEPILRLVPLTDGRIIAAGEGEPLKIWDPENPSDEFIVLPRRDTLTNRFFPPIEVLSEGRLAVGTEDGLIEIYDLDK